MKASWKAILGLLSVAGLIAVPALAAGPVDGEVGAVWWANDFDSELGAASTSADAGAPGFRAEVWFLNNFGVRGATHGSDPDVSGADSSQFTSVDVLWRPFSPTENSFVALGAGWQEMDLDTIGLGDTASGARVSAEGRVGVGGLVYLYGQGSYMPSLGDGNAIDPSIGVFKDMEGQELELGVTWNMMPFVALRAAYRAAELDYVLTDFDPVGTRIEGKAESTGIVAGVSVTF